MKNLTPLKKVCIAIALALVIGSFTGTSKGILGITYFQIFELGGELFLNALTLLVIPLIISAIISSLGKMNGEKSFKSLGLKTFGFYLLTIACAIFVGVIVSNIFIPDTSHAQLESSSNLNAMIETVNEKSALSQIFLNIVPPNVFLAASDGNMLGIIFFSLLFGFALMKLNGKTHEILLIFWTGTFQVFMKMTQFVMKLMPIGVFCLIAKIVASQGLESISNLFSFFITVVLGLLLFTCLCLPLLLKCFRLNPISHIRAISPALFTAFSTSSSAATIPIAMDCLEKTAGVSKRICSFVIPLGTSMNMAGSALYACSSIFFIAHTYGIEMGWGQQITIAFLSLITSMGVAGIPSGSLVTILIILKSIGLPTEALALIIPLDRILDMFRTAANIYSGATCAVLVAHTEGESLFTKENPLPNPL